METCNKAVTLSLGRMKSKTRTMRVLFFMSQLVNVQINLQRFSVDFTVRRNSERKCRTEKNNYQSTQHTKLILRAASFQRKLHNCLLPGWKIAPVSSNTCFRHFSNKMVIQIFTMVCFSRGQIERFKRNKLSKLLSLNSHGHC